MNQTLSKRYEEYKTNSSGIFFSDPQLTKEDAQDIHQQTGLFDQAAVYLTPDNQYIMGKIRRPDWSNKHFQSIAYGMEKLIGCRLVSICDPLLGIWKDYAWVIGEANGE